MRQLTALDDADGPARRRSLDRKDVRATVSDTQPGRRRFPRVQAPVLYRPMDSGKFHGLHAPADVSLGGMRVYSDEYMKPGTPIQLEVLLPDRTSIRCGAEVAWIEGFAGPTGSSYEVGLKFTDMAPEDVARMESVLERADDRSQLSRAAWSARPAGSGRL